MGNGGTDAGLMLSGMREASQMKSGCRIFPTWYCMTVEDVSVPLGDLWCLGQRKVGFGFMFMLAPLHGGERGKIRLKNLKPFFEGHYNIEINTLSLILPIVFLN